MLVCKRLCVCECVCEHKRFVSAFLIYWDTKGPACPWNIGHTPTLSSVLRGRRIQFRGLAWNMKDDLSFWAAAFSFQFWIYLDSACSPLLALLISVSPVQSTLAVQQVHVATDRRLLTANHSAVQPLAPPFYVTQEMLHRHILGRARVHGIEDQGEAGEGGGLRATCPASVTCWREKGILKKLFSAWGFAKSEGKHLWGDM